MERKNDGKCEWKGTTRSEREIICTALLIDIDVSSHEKCRRLIMKISLPKTVFSSKRDRLRRKAKESRNYTEKEISFGATIRRRRRRRGGG